VSLHGKKGLGKKTKKKLVHPERIWVMRGKKFKSYKVMNAHIGDLQNDF
jgi:hypothetical protein